MRVADFIFRFLADRGVQHVFLVTGGGAMHLNDGLRKEKRLHPVCCHHEQGCSIAAEGYFRASGKMAAVSVTSGPGGTNALTGVAGQWLDSIPAIYISGQVKFETTIASCPDLGLRQLGDQELNIVDVVRPLTKYCAFVSDPRKIREALEAAFYHALSGRKGPVWLDIPLNVQGSEIDPDDLPAFVVPESGSTSLVEVCEQTIGLLKKAERPVLIAGWGIRLGSGNDALMELLDECPIPVVTTFNGIDQVPMEHSCYAGRIGTLGQRVGNFVLQNADLVLSVGTRNNVRQTSFNWENYCRNAVKIAVDIDPAELEKKTFIPDLPICADAGTFLNTLVPSVKQSSLPKWNAWHAWVAERKAKNPVHTEEHRHWSDRINPYHFTHVLTDMLPNDVDIVAGNGTACVALFQTGIVKKGQRIFWNSGCASMGYDLPAALGAGIATGRMTICLAGDGSIMMNIQELQTIVYRNLPIKIFILDNNGYGSIKQTQTNFFGSELIGCDAQSGVSFPDFGKVCAAFGFPTFSVDDQKKLPDVLDRVLKTPGPAVCVVRLPDFFAFAPKLASRKLPDGSMQSSPPEDMFPFLSRSEFASNMFTPNK